MTDLRGKVAFITGGSKGIGYGVAASLLKEGMKVAITGRSQQALDEAVSRLSSDDVLALEADVRSFDSQQQAVQKTIEKWGKIDLLVANAGIGHYTSIEDLTPDLWNETIDTNLTGVFYSVKASLEALKKSKGYIITISSLAGISFSAGGSAYNASKFGLTGFSQAIMLDLRKYDVKVSTILPGSVASNFNNHIPSETDNWKIQPEDIGEIIIDVMKMTPRTLPSKIEVRPSAPPSAK
ncbi:short-chain dehydrogenase [Flavobacterium palustre]|uniref:Short-chain dehydrogenase n=1 Tax=Flavobacterium palustre TaxID=1476463 RepID=A0ABQ1HDS7_9FLAO|nr:SDR family oxidoreductase [Flavobacterium palustre]GGA72740.1 short-chain dehydrogenase [Flavobacterium palustre]